TVTQLGRIWLSGNSLNHALKLVDASTGADVPNGSVSLSMAGGSAGQFVYANLPGAITLAPNTSYYLVSQETPGGDQWAYDDAMVTTTSDATCDGAALRSVGSPWTFRPYPLKNTFGPVSFKYSASNLSPAVAITSPADGSSYTAPASISIAANASDSDGTVSKVDFFSGANLLATAPTSPYAFVWNNVLAGNYTLIAKATDNLGAVGNSAAINVTVATGGASTPFVTSFVPGSSENNFSGWLGMGFTVGSAPITVTQLGRLWLSGNSLVHALKLVDATTRADVPNGSVSLSMAGGSAGQFVYGILPGAITLLANTRYYLVSQETPGGDQWAYDNTRVTTTSAATCDGPALKNANGGWILRLVPNTTFVPVNFK
ncbi:MAG: Ig-like domain-containing protein, partial [Verrucomicrobiota bacterium]